jgi:hypothetical protein
VSSEIHWRPTASRLVLKGKEHPAGSRSTDRRLLRVLVGRAFWNVMSSIERADIARKANMSRNAHRASVSVREMQREAIAAGGVGSPPSKGFGGRER